MAEIPKGDEGQIELRGDASWYRFQKDASQHGGSKGIEKQTMSMGKARKGCKASQGCVGRPKPAMG